MLASWRFMTKIAGSGSGPLFKSMDPRIRIRIHTNMLWIRNTGKNKSKDLKIKIRPSERSLAWSLVPSSSPPLLLIRQPSNRCDGGGGAKRRSAAAPSDGVITPKGTCGSRWGIAAGGDVAAASSLMAGLWGVSRGGLSNEGPESEKECRRCEGGDKLLGFAGGGGGSGGWVLRLKFELDLKSKLF